MFRLLLKFIVIIIEKILDWFAMVAAFMSVAQTGDIMTRMIGTLMSLYRTGYGFAHAYVKNENFNDAWTSFTKAFDGALASAAENIQKDPQMVLVAFILTFVVFKLVAWLLKQFRKSMLKRRPKIIKPKSQNIKRPTPPKSKTYDKLYKPPEISSSTQAVLDDSKKRVESDDNDEDVFGPSDWKRKGEDEF